MASAGLGVDFKNSLRKPGQWRMGLGGFGECLPNHNNRIEIDKDKLDAWGIPTLKINCDWGENEHAMSKDIAIQAAEMLAASGATDIGVYSEITRPGLAIHEMGTAAMGRDPKTSALNEHNKAHDVKNLLMTDGSCMVSNRCANPSRTYMELTARSTAYAAAPRTKHQV